MVRTPSSRWTALALLAAFASTAATLAQNLRGAVITQKIDETRLTALTGNLRSAALDPANDRGSVAADLPLDHMLLQLQRSPQSEAALTAYIASLNDTDSPNFHKWLTAQQLGEQYGPAPADIAIVTGWLQSHGLIVNQVYPTGMVIDFSGSAAQVEAAFHPALHNLLVNGVAHIANTANPSIPSALVGVVSGVVSLNDFLPHPMQKAVQTAHIDVHTGTSTLQGPDYTYTSGSSTYEAVVPGDLATIYNLTPLFTAGYSGQGQTIVVIEDTNVYATADWSTFRSKFGLSTYTAGSFTQVHPGSNCTNPGVNADDGEAILDAEWASAAAPNAAIELASCADTRTTFGGLIALQNIISRSHPADDHQHQLRRVREPRTAPPPTPPTTPPTSGRGRGRLGLRLRRRRGRGQLRRRRHQGHPRHRRQRLRLHALQRRRRRHRLRRHLRTAPTPPTGTPPTPATFGSAKSYIPEIPWNDSCASVLLAKAYTATASPTAPPASATPPPARRTT